MLSQLILYLAGFCVGAVILSTAALWVFADRLIRECDADALEQD